MSFNPDESRDEKGRWTGTGSAPPIAEPIEADKTPEAALAQAKEVAGGYPALVGLPQKPVKIGDVYYAPGPVGRLKDAAAAYMQSANLPYKPIETYQKVDPARATRIADEFEKMVHAPGDPGVKASYDALAKETIAQWHAIEATGLKVEWIKPGQDDPYAKSPRLAELDVSLHNHWWGFPTDQGFGTGPEAEAAKQDNPLLTDAGVTIDGRKCVVNDVFRIVHDMFGHCKEGNGFRADGEDNAWRSHAAMYSPLARAAMTSETRGQNSWVNFGPYAASNKIANAGDTHYAPQKIGIMPEWTRNEGRLDPPMVAGQTLSAWASKIANSDADRIDKTIRTGLIAGHDNAEIARRVVGSLAQNGADGITEITRKQITMLGRTALRLRNKAGG